MPQTLPEPKADKRFFPCSTDQVKDAVWQICDNARRKGFTAKEIQVLAPMYKGPAEHLGLIMWLQDIMLK